jgi:repressor LexA
MDGSDLSDRQRQILDFIVDVQESRGYPPTVREIGEAVGLTSPSTVHAHLQTLQEKGYLRRDPTKPRAIEVRWEREVGIVEERRPGVRNLPIYGSIAAGPTSLAEQRHEGILPFPKDFVGDGPHFALVVKGDSMIEAGIFDGDLAVIRSQPDASNGEVVAAQVTGPTGEAEATIKGFKRTDGKILLVPANPAMQPFEAPQDLRILGKVVALVRRL